MSEALLHVGLFFLGLVHTLPSQRATGIYFACAAAYVTGLVCWVLIGLFLIVLPLPFSRPAAEAGVTLVAGAGLVRTIFAVRAADGMPWRVIASWSAAFALCAIAFDSLNVAVLTVDSHTYIGTGRSLASFGDLGVLAGQLTNIGVFQVLVHSLSVFIDVPYLHEVGPMLAISGLACFVVLGVRGLAPPTNRRSARAPAIRAATLVVLAALATTTPYFMLSQALYIHTNFAAATYLFLFCATIWLAEVEQQPAWLPFAFMFLLAFALQRLELPIFALLFFVLSSTEMSRPQRIANRWFAAFALPLVVWYGYLSTIDSPATRLLSPSRAIAMILLIGGAWPVARWLQSQSARKIRHYVPAATLALPALGIAVAAGISPVQMLESVAAMLAHVTDPVWGATWIALPALGIAAWRARPLPLQRVFTYGCVATLLLIVLAGALRAGYHDGLTDSGNRMLTHVVPTLYFFLTMSLGRATLQHVSPR